MLEAVFFDFDGVIVDTPSYYFRHMRDYLRERHSGIKDDDIADLLGLTFAKKVEKINRRYGLSVNRAHFVETTSGKVLEEMEKSLVLDQGLGRLLSELRQAGIPCAIASNNSRKNIDFFLKRLGISDFFREIISFENVRDWKPHPETYLNAAKALGVKPSCSVAIEDTVVGLMSAKAAGLKCVVMPNRFNANHDFSASDLVIRNLGQLDAAKLISLVEQ